MEPDKNKIHNEVNAPKVGYYTAILTALLTLITFGIAILTPPLSGPSCRSDCLEYPYTDIVSRFPRDYLWMYPAILLTLTYLVLMVCIHHHASMDKNILSQIGLLFAVISATILVIDYFIQISVIQPSLENGEMDGIALLTQYNPHGIFIALEELGYLMMSASFFFAAFVFTEPNRVERAIRWILFLSFVLTILSLLMIGAAYGIEREYRFEIFAICINWFALLGISLLLSKVFRQTINQD